MRGDVGGIDNSVEVGVEHIVVGAAIEHEQPNWVL